MKRANAKAGIASVVAGLAVLSGASAHATFLYLSQFQSIAASGVAPANVAIAHAGVQSAAADGEDTVSSYLTGYATPGFRWMTTRDALHADNVLLGYRTGSSTADRAVSGSPAATSPAKDSPLLDGATTPVASSPVAEGANPPSMTASTETGSPPANWVPISLSAGVETPVVGVPSKSVPEPSTVGLLGIGLLLAFVGIGRGKRTRRERDSFAA